MVNQKPVLDSKRSRPWPAARGRDGALAFTSQVPILVSTYRTDNNTVPVSNQSVEIV